MSVASWIFLCLGATALSEVMEVREADPMVITTWAFANATAKAWSVLHSERGSALDAVERGCRVCEDEQCDFTVGFGGSPDETGETTLDAMIMDGNTFKVGAVGGLRRIKNAVSVARRVLDHSKHTFLVGDAATKFARVMEFPEENLTTSHSRDLQQKWMQGNCQPNYWQNVVPDPTKSCGPYSPKKSVRLAIDHQTFTDGGNHDTIGMVAMDVNGSVASATSTNGLVHKIPGRVGDSPIAGAGSYADSTVGGAAATGDGDVMMRFLPSFLAVEEMKRGASPTEAARTAVKRISHVHPNFFGAVIALRKDGRLGAACNGMDMFPYMIADRKGVRLIKIKCK